jgi:hypothetical protein
LKALATIWREQRSTLETEGKFHQFVKHLQREWAIETGIIERLYTWDRGVTVALIEQGIDASLIAHKSGLAPGEAKHAFDLITDQLAVVEGLFAFVKGEQPLTEHYIRSLHQELTAHQETTEAQTEGGQRVSIPLLRGQYKVYPNNPRRPDGSDHSYCPPVLVPDEMARLVAWCCEHERKAPPEVLSAWLHHAFTQIHPFQDGNGRIARALSSMVFLRAGLFPLVVRNSDRADYIAALESADASDLRPLVELFGNRQREAILKAIGIEHEVRTAGLADQVLDAALGVLEARADNRQKEMVGVLETADGLLATARERVSTIEAKLRERLEALAPPETTYKVAMDVCEDTDERSHYFHRQIVETAGTLGYYANTNAYRAWLRLAIQTETRFEIVLSLHGYGRDFRGIMAGSLFTSMRVPREEGGTDAIEVRPAALEFFQFNYREESEATMRRFEGWLERSLALALGEWRRLLETPPGR